MDNKDQRMLKAAAIGFAQSCINRGATEQEAMLLTHLYVDPSNGLLAKQAAARTEMKNNINTIINFLRAAN